MKFILVTVALFIFSYVLIAYAWKNLKADYEDWQQECLDEEEDD